VREVGVARIDDTAPSISFESGVGRASARRNGGCCYRCIDACKLTCLSIARLRDGGNKSKVEVPLFPFDNSLKLLLTRSKARDDLQDDQEVRIRRGQDSPASAAPLSLFYGGSGGEDGEMGMAETSRTTRERSGGA
jgi:hypothetical protein